MLQSAKLDYLLQWAILLFYYNTSEKPVFNQLSKWHKILHILGNTWISIPARSVRQVDQHFKAKEQVALLVISGLNIATTSVTAAFLMDERAPRFWTDNTSQGLSTKEEFLLFVGLPSLLSHILGCLLILFYYKCCHTFRGLPRSRDKECGTCPCCCCCTCICMCDSEEAIIVERGPWEE